MQVKAVSYTHLDVYKRQVHDEDFKKWITPGSGYLPEGAEPTEQFHARCADSLLKLFEYMIRMDAVSYTHLEMPMVRCKPAAGRFPTPRVPSPPSSSMPAVPRPCSSCLSI